MKHIVKPFIIAFVVLCGCVSGMLAQRVTYDPSQFIDIDINSGNPAFPFPQFLEYEKGYSLAKHNAEGVTHADMEKTMREAYEIMSHRCRYFGGTHCGVKYIVFNPGGEVNSTYTYPFVPGDAGNIFCSEGDGYMLLASAIYADQKTFNGLYMWIHDNRFSGVKRFQDGRVLRTDKPDYAGPYMAGWKCDETTQDMGDCHSATDGDVDIAMAVLIAYKQWGEWLMQDGKKIEDSEGNPISLKEEARRVLGAMVDLYPVSDPNNGAFAGCLSGDIGIDGYMKSGNSWGELTRWRFSPEGIAYCPEANGSGSGMGAGIESIFGDVYADYNAPSYFREFWMWLADKSEEGGNGTDWQVNQYKRAEVSSEWLNEQAYKQGYYPTIGKVLMTEGDEEHPTFGIFSGSGGEDFRYAWRHGLTYLWHGTNENGWDPKTHQVVPASGEDYIYKMAERYAQLFKEPKENGSVLCVQAGAAPDPGQPYWFGPALIPQQWDLTGTIMQPNNTCRTNYALGAGTPCVVAVGEKEPQLLADIYRQCELVWDSNNQDVAFNSEERYLGSTPKYFHGWFRNLGLLTCSGNMHAPSKMKRAANMKVYMDVDKTYAYVDDKITYKVDYRNYGSLAAEDVVIETELDPDYELVNVEGNGKLEGNKIVWHIGTVPGFVSGGLDATRDSMKFTVRVVGFENERVCLRSVVSGSNFEEWISNEYPNNATYTMERNCVDILASRSLSLKKTATRNALNPNDVVSFTLEFENRSEGESSWLNGGRDNVRVSYACNLENSSYMMQGFRIWQDASEAYINIGNYRVSYFLNDPAAIGLYDPVENPSGWQFSVNNLLDMRKYGMSFGKDTVTFSHQRIPYGTDSVTGKKWNQRLIIRFPEALMSPTTHIFDKIATMNDGPNSPASNMYLHHRGICGPPFIRTMLQAKNADMFEKVKDDWSYDANLNYMSTSGQDSPLSVVTPCWANYDNMPYDINLHARHVCKSPNIITTDKVLVEEFDGYTWRRIQGNGPLPGREAYDVTILDTIPEELEFYKWIDSTALKNEDGEKIKAQFISPEVSHTKSGVVKWTIPTMLVGEKDKLIYQCVARDLGCPDVEDKYYKNVAWISSKTDSPDSSQVELMTTCRELPPVADPQTSLFKTTPVKNVNEGDVVPYRIKFVNTEGTKVVANCKSKDGWIKLGNGSVADLGTEGLKLSTNGSSSYFFAPEKSYGVDGNVYARFGGNPSVTQDLYIVFRYQNGSGNPGSSTFKGVCMQLVINQAGKNQLGYRLFNDGKLIQEQGVGNDAWKTIVRYGGKNSTSPIFKFTLVGEKLFMYANDEEDNWENLDLAIGEWSGLTSSAPGYFGIYVNSNGNASTQLTEYTTELDYAFDITLYDDVPTELENISNISDGGTYDASKRRITWPTVATETSSALAPGDSIVYTFDAEVDNCGKYITNMGLATVYGQDTLKVLNTIQCGVEECELVRADIQFANDVDKICEGDSVLLSGFGDDGKDGSRFMYEFFLDGISLGRASYTGEIYVNKTGSYHVKVSSPIDPTCFLESNKITLNVNERPVGQDFPLGTLCVGTDPSDNAKYAEMMTVIDGRPAGVNYNWVGDNGGVPLVFPSVSTDAVGDFDKPYFLNTEDGCVSDTFHLTYTVADTAVVKLSDLTICSGQSGTLTAGTDLTYTYLWSDGSTLNELVTDQPGKYSVVVTTPDGCESKASATITVADELKVDLGTDTTICEGNLPLVLDASSSYDTYEWTDGSSLSTLSVTESGEYEVKVTQGSCTGSGKISVTVSPTPVLKGTFKVTYLVNDTTAAGVFDKSLTAYDATVLEKESGVTYTWYDENQNELSSEPIPDVPVGGGNGAAIYYVKATNADGCETLLQLVQVQISGSPMPTAPDVAYCLNATDVKPLEATPGDNGSATNWTLRWYDAVGNQLNDAPVPDVTVAGATNYYVSQVDEQGTEGGKAIVTVNVYALPQIEAEPQNVTLCNTPYALNTAFREANGLSVTYSYYDTNKDPMTDTDPKAETSGLYYAKASYAPVTDLLCESADFSSVDVLIDQITDIKLVASPSICPLGETELSISAKSEGSPVAFSWSGDASSTDPTLAVKDETGEYGKVYSYDLKVTAGLCVFDTTVTVTVGRGVLTGALTANNVETKRYRTCGDEDIVLGATHDGSDFKWTTSDGVLLEANASTTVRPTQTTTYVLSFVNECETSDTMVVEVYPFSLSTQFSGLDTAVCMGSSASGSLLLNGYDKTMEGSYIKWFKDNVEMPEYEGLSTLEIPRTTAQDGGVYTFEASNGICLAKNMDGVTSAKLTVKPFVSFSTPTDVVVANGASVSLELQDLVPSDATVTWKGSVNEGIGNPYQIDQVFVDELFDVNVSAEGYCDLDAQLQLVVDAKVIVSASTSTPKICLNDAASLVADTTGTGHLLHPEQYSVVWYACDESGNCESLQMKGLSLTHYPESNISYYAVVTYGDQVAYSDTIPVAVIPQVSYTTSSDVVSCSGEEVTLSVEIEDATDAVVTWADGTQGNTLSVNPTESSRYAFTITQDGICPQMDSIQVLVMVNPSVTMEDDILVCRGNAVNFAPAVSGDNIEAYYWINPSGDTIAYTQNLTLSIEPQSGVYTFVAVSMFCGEAVGTQKVDIAELPELLIDSLSINSRKLVPVGRAGQYEFKLDNKEWSTQDVYENLVYDYPHTALVRDELGCEGMTVFVVTAPPIAIPDYFTPSEDGLNDTWDLSTIMDAYPKTEVTIYDRSGKVVAVLEGDTSEWDGTYNGKPLPSTDYWYVINVPEIRRQFTGHFTLLRTK